ncbi:MAG: 3-dehydroquinate synthase [Defluviitaleaceae bacterium]|nr:3-dehydroquinate synthase [Defluviitaleaceae bacterium]
MTEIKVNASKKYSVHIGKNFLSDAGKRVRETCGGQKAAVVADDVTAVLFANELISSLNGNGYETHLFVFKNGEHSKNAETFLSVINFFAEKKLSRADVAVALGGGVAGDITGFAAACYMRGVRFVQIPTTLLAMVDSSVGGKTAVNLAAGKNLLGAFYQPDLVLCDISLLGSLPEKIFNDGLAEVIKYGVIASRGLFDSLKNFCPQDLERIVSECVDIKRGVVDEDEFENGRRKILNFGHTVGHAIEKLSGYGETHGRAVAAGMAAEARLAAHIGICGADCASEIENLCGRFNLPAYTEYGAERIAEACLADKKREGSRITFALPEKIGACALTEVAVEKLPVLLGLSLGKT